MNSITYSAIKTFLSCRKKFYYQYIRRLKPLEKPVYLDIGSAVHEAFEIWYTTKKIEDAHKKINTYFQERLPSTDDENYEEKLQTANNNHDISMRIFDRYVNQYQDDPDLEIIEVEKEFSLNAKEIGIDIDIEIKLKVDAIIKKGGIMYLMEHKTAAAIDTNYKSKLIVDLQSMFYIICLNALGYPVKGVCYNVVKSKLPAMPELLKSGKLSMAKNRKPDLGEYIKAIEKYGLDQSDYESYLDWLKDNQSESFYRDYIVYHDLQLEKLCFEIGEIIKDIKHVTDRIETETITSHKGIEGIYKNTQDCIRYGACSFFDTCVSLYPETVIENSFIERQTVHEEYKNESDKSE